MEELVVPPRLFVSPGVPLSTALELDLPEQVSRHVQVLRLQPEDSVVLFDGLGGQWSARILSMGRKVVRVAVESHEPVSKELPRSVTLAVGMPANDRMDALVEKATELGACGIQPLMCERSVLRLDGERALKKVAHWQAVAVAAAEQSGRTAVPVVHGVRTLNQWLQQVRPSEAQCGLLSLRQTSSIAQWAQSRVLTGPVYFLSGPEGGLTPGEEDQALQAGWQAVSLGARILRADTAPMAALSVMAAMWER